MRYLLYRKWLWQWLAVFLLSLLILGLGRVFLFYRYVSAAVREGAAADIGALFVKGLQFDIKVSAMLVALPLLLGAISLAGERSAAWFDRHQNKLLSALLLVLLTATVANVFYFDVYERQCDVFVCGLVDEDPVAVLQTVWSDFPVLSALPILAALGWAAYRLLHWVRRADQPIRQQEGWCWKMAWVLLPVLLLAVGIRGSLGKFPLRQDAAQISASPQLNRLVPNALISLDWARKEYQNSGSFHEVSDEEGLNLISRVQGAPAASAALSQFVVQTPHHAALEARRPNVALAVMESMGSHLLQLDAPQRDLLGALAPHFKQDWVFRKFVSEGDGTSDSLHRLFVRSPRLNLSQSTAKNKTFISNIFKPYQDAGYRTLYITAGNGGWRDFDNFLTHLGVDDFVDENTLKARYPEAKSDTWGVPDEYMFRYAAEELAEAEKSGRPVFVMMMSMTNHPPYKLPAPHQKQAFKLNHEEQARFEHLAENEELNEILNTFRYSNDQLGQFIGRVKTRAPHTVIAATGDHNMRAIGYPEPDEAALGHAVPFYLYVPPEYRSAAVYRPERAGSHKDVMPTLYALSLSGHDYYQNGCNLVATVQSSPWCGYGYNTEVLLTEHGFFNLGSREYRRWQSGTDLRAQAKAETPPADEQALIDKGRAYGDFLNWQLNRMVMQQPDRNGN